VHTLKIRTVKYKGVQSVVCKISRAEQTEQQCSENADEIFGFLVTDFHSELLYATPQRVMQHTRHICNACRIIMYSIINRNFQNAGRWHSILLLTASHPDMQKIRIIGFFFENRLHWLFKVRLLRLRLNLSTTPDLKF